MPGGWSREIGVTEDSTWVVRLDEPAEICKPRVELRPLVALAEDFAQCGLGWNGCKLPRWFNECVYGRASGCQVKWTPNILFVGGTEPELVGRDGRSRHSSQGAQWLSEPAQRLDGHCYASTNTRSGSRAAARVTRAEVGGAQPRTVRLGQCTIVRHAASVALATTRRHFRWSSTHLTQTCRDVPSKSVMR